MKTLIFGGAFAGGLFSALVLVFLFLAFKHGVGWYFWAEDEKSVSILSDIVLPLFSTFFGAAAGSYYTYRLQLITKNKELIEKDVYLLRKAYLVLESQLNDLASLKKIKILPYADLQLRFLSMPITIGSGGVIAALDQDVAVPLVRLKEAEALSRTRFAEKSYLSCLDIQRGYEELMRLYLKRLQDGGVNHLDVSSLQKRTKLAGGATIAQMYLTGEALISAVDDALIDLKWTLEKLSQIFDKNFKSAEGQGLSFSMIKGAEYIFDRVPPPKVSSISQLLELADYTPVYHDPKDDESYPLIKLATSSWQPSIYTRRLRFVS